METRKTGKYFKYAIGEIVLVVIGILIALSINNWNEQRKIRLNTQTYIDNLLDSINSMQLYYIKYYPVNQTFNSLVNSGNGNLLNDEKRDFLNALVSKQDELAIINDVLISRANDQFIFSEQLLGASKNFYSQLKVVNTNERKTQGLLHSHLHLNALNELYSYLISRGKQIKKLSHEAIILLKKPSND